MDRLGVSHDEALTVLFERYHRLVLRIALKSSGKRWSSRYENPHGSVIGLSPLRKLVPQFGKIRKATSAKAKDLLGWAPRPNDEVNVAKGESRMSLGLIKD